jgi:hypothetical protein
MSPTEIRAQIEHTRAEMTHTIDAIQSRLSPSRIVSDAKQTAMDVTVTRARQIADTVRSNPLPFAVAGATVMALLVRRIVRSRSVRRRHRPA